MFLSFLNKVRKKVSYTKKVKSKVMKKYPT